MTKKKVKNKEPSKRWEKYKIEGTKLIRSKTCPKCGDGIFMGEHKNRFFCGKCKYTEFKSK